MKLISRLILVLMVSTSVTAKGIIYIKEQDIKNQELITKSQVQLKNIWPSLEVREKQCLGVNQNRVTFSHCKADGTHWYFVGQKESAQIMNGATHTCLLFVPESPLLCGLFSKPKAMLGDCNDSGAHWQVQVRKGNNMLYQFASLLDDVYFLNADGISTMIYHNDWQIIAE